MRGKDTCLVDADFRRSASRWHSKSEQSQILPLITLVEKRDNILQILKSLDATYTHVIVDVAGRNSREFITGSTVAH
ncbi:hypothetical protein [Candidatus Williamhamiltonella defendens]|uniref:hypothetical protein n=1 Tax=Candidatus Williamhamiltonella defendens TaxID=138072 RepID=UPI001F3F112C|nr:hypothetical protein [Candidatus Hamiltonella defensa]